MKTQTDQMRHDRDPLEAECPPEVIEVFRQRLASLDRGEGLTTEQLRERRQARRQQQAPAPSSR